MLCASLASRNGLWYAFHFMPKTLDTTTLQMALIGYEAERKKIVARILELELQLKRSAVRAATSVANTTPVKRGRRRMSAAARKRIAEAQKKRWAAYKKKQKTA